MEKGGIFSGRLVIGQADLTQAELLPEQNRRSRARTNPASREPRRSLCPQLSFALTQKLHPRSPYAKLGGYVHLPRLIDKAKLHRQGLLDGYNYKTVGFDKHLLAFLKLNGDAFEEAANRLEEDAAILNWVEENGEKHSPEATEQWNEAMISRHPDTAAKKRASSIFSSNQAAKAAKIFGLISISSSSMKVV